MASDMKKIESTDKICAIKVEEDNEKIISFGLIMPILLLGLLIALVRYMCHCLWLEAIATDPYADPFKNIWWSGPIFFSFLYFITIYFGLKYMKDRKPFQIKPYIFTYNLYQCVLNIWTVAEVIREIYTNPWFNKTPWGNTPQPTIGGFRIGLLVWIHYNNKYVELLDTLWMVLRKKNKQVSFLHCYHHILLIWSWFVAVRIEAGGDCYFGATVNSFIHVIMYGYYTLALVGIPCPWKKWITTCQMIQFVVVLCHSCYVTYKGNMPITLPLLQGFVMINMLVLFGQFMKENYGKKTEKKTE
jgi:elongation of very long chain fatty acids protein 4